MDVHFCIVKEPKLLVSSEIRHESVKCFMIICVIFLWEVSEPPPSVSVTGKKIYYKA